MKYRKPQEILDAVQIISSLTEDEKPWGKKNAKLWNAIAARINSCDSYNGRQLTYSGIKKLDAW